MRSPRPSAAEPPRFTIATAVYNVERYLPDYVASIERQTFDLGRVEVIVVDDGSTDGSLAFLENWRARRPELVTVLSKPNGGQGSARNLALDHARGEWVTFLDPDDWVDDDYLATVDAFAAANEEVMLVGTYRIFVDEPDLTVRDRHPLRGLFREDRVVNLDRFPDFFHGSAPSAFVRRAVVERQGLRFDERVQPNFEDGHFCARYLLDLEGPPMLGLLRSAEYYYRKRSDQSSTLQNSLLDPRRFIDVPRHGYLGLLRSAAERRGEIPLWLKNMILYEVSFYFSSDESATAAATAAVGATGKEFVEILAEIVELIGEDAINGFTMRNLKQRWIDVMIHGLRGEPWSTPYVVTRGFDPGHRQVKLGFLFTGPEPAARYLLRGREVTPKHQKVRSIEYFGQQLMFERLVWVKATGTLRVELGGAPGSFRKGDLSTRTIRSMRPSVLERWFRVVDPPVPERWPRRLLGHVRARLEAVRRRYRLEAFVDRWTVRTARWGPTRRVFGGSWILLDRLHDANDSAEILFHTLRREHPNVNAWFVLSRDSADWERLAPIAGRRLLRHGSFRWKLAMLNCRYLISSHADQPIRRPPAIARLGQPAHKFVFLQHGVIKDDLSRWLNGKSIDLFITSTAAEHQSIVGDRTPYVYTTKEVKVTGLPRFDALEAAKRRLGESEPDLILVAPTWRQWLTMFEADGSGRADLDRHLAVFQQSEYAERWGSVLASRRLRDVAASKGLTIAFLPHPNIVPAIAAFDLDDDLVVADYARPDLHDVFARTAVMITDYSSMAFNAAYLERPVVYFQFDGDRVRAGGHLGRQGYFDYRRDGFGPVVEEADDVIAAVDSILSGALDPEVRERILETFPHRDGECSRRVIREIRALG